MSMRVIVLDTETTGLSPKDHRIIEIGCVELIQGEPTGETFQRYVNPQRDIHPDALKVHGLTQDFLQNHLTFPEILPAFLDFIQNSTLVIHNAKFDISFLNAELQRLNKPPLSNAVRDTLSIARKRFPGSPASLDALCKHFGVDLASRTRHGALLDAQLLSEVYRELMGGLQEDLKFVSSPKIRKKAFSPHNLKTPRVFHLSDEEIRAHKFLQEKLRSLSSP